MKKRILATFLSIIMVVTMGLTACSDAKGESSRTEDDGKENTEGSETKMDTLEVFINMSWYPTDKFEGIIPNLIKEATGVDLNVTIATSNEQLGVMISSGELPDLIYTDSEIDRLSNSKFCYSYSELEELYGASFEDLGDEAIAIAKSYSEDGDYYTVLNATATSDDWENMKLGAVGQPTIMYRSDLMDELGNPKINTLEDFVEVLELCKTTFPDMVPFGLGGVYKSQYIKNVMGVTNNIYDGATGEYYYEASAPGYKECMQLMNEFALKGYIEAEYYANENDGDGKQYFYNGDCVFFADYLGYNDYTVIRNNVQSVNPAADVAILPWIGEGGVPMGSNAGWAGCFVSRNCSNPEAAARLLTYQLSNEGRQAGMWGREGIDYTLGDDGVPIFSEEFKEVRDNGELVEVYNYRFSFYFTAIDEIYMNLSGGNQEILDIFATYRKGYQNYPELAMARPAASTDEGVIYTKLEELKKSYEAKLIFAASETEFESTYAEYMEALEQTGLQQYNDYMTTSIVEARKLLGK